LDGDGSCAADLFREKAEKIFLESESLGFPKAQTTDVLILSIHLIFFKFMFWGYGLTYWKQWCLFFFDQDVKGNIKQ
jgi:hypothetical protein